jgi:hypothetical protein
MKLDIVQWEQKRDLVPFKKDSTKEQIDELAIGSETNRLFVRGPTGRLYVIDNVPSGLLQEIATTEPS